MPFEERLKVLVVPFIIITHLYNKHSERAERKSEAVDLPLDPNSSALVETERMRSWTRAAEMNFLQRAAVLSVSQRSATCSSRATD